MNENAQIKIITATPKDLDRCMAMAATMGGAKPLGYFEQAFEQQASRKRDIFIAVCDGVDIGYCMLAWAPKYRFYQVMDIPEIQDLNILPPYRRRGFARAMIDHCEAIARDAGRTQIGIGVGMDESYGAAQRLYVRLGYIPDGHGLTYDRQIIPHGASMPVDDDMSLMFVKDL